MPNAPETTIDNSVGYGWLSTRADGGKCATDSLAKDSELKPILHFLDPFSPQTNIQHPEAESSSLDELQESSRPQPHRKSSGGDYAIARTQQEAARLNKQHLIYLQNIGYRLHPTINSTLTPHTRIADIGTGTGIVLLDLAQHAPLTVRLDGYDVSPSLFPHSYPSNVTFHVHDARKPFPESLHGTYDIVYLRLLVAGLKKDDWQIVAENAVRLLKPGGRIQWIEADHSRMFLTPLKGWPGSSTLAMAYWGRRILDLAVGERTRYGWSTLEGIFGAMGLEGIVHEVVSSDNCAETRVAGTDVQVGVCGSMAMLPHVLEEVGGKKGVEEMLKAMKADQASGAYVRWDIHIFLAIRT